MINVTAIKLPEDFDTYKNVKDEEKAEFLEPISKINIFVGSNNSGKSRFMRQLSFQTDYNVKVADINLEIANSSLLEIIDGLDSLFDNYCVVSINEITIGKLKGMRQSLTSSMNLSHDSYKNVRENFQKWEEISAVDSHTENSHLVTSIQNSTRSRFSAQKVKDFPPIIKSKSQDALKLLDKIPIHSESTKPKKIYIPILRGLRPLDDTHKDFYSLRTKRDYFKSPINDNPNNQKFDEACPQIFTGLGLYEEIAKLRDGEYSQRNLITKQVSICNQVF